MPELTYPHDYRTLFGGKERPLIVGGQAVNLWAITLLDTQDPNLSRERFGSHDLDVIASRNVLDFLKTLPDWRYTQTPVRFFNCGITAKLQSVAPDGRPLLVEVLHSVAGLDAADLKFVSELTGEDGAIFRLLDPLIMLKAKAYNVRSFPQDEAGAPRHDVDHLKILARCFTPYLRELHVTADTLERVEAVTDATKLAYKVLTDNKTAATLRSVGIPPESLVPAEFELSPIAKISRAWLYQQPRVARAGLSTKPDVGPSPRV